MKNTVIYKANSTNVYKATTRVIRATAKSIDYHPLKIVNKIKIKET